MAAAVFGKQTVLFLRRGRRFAALLLLLLQPQAEAAVLALGTILVSHPRFPEDAEEIPSGRHCASSDHRDHR